MLNLNTIKYLFTYLKFSLNLTVAAQWNIILIESMMTSLSSSLRASLGWVSSLLIAMTFSLKSGFSSLNLSKSYQKEKMFYDNYFQLSKPIISLFSPPRITLFKTSTMHITIQVGYGEHSKAQRRQLMTNILLHWETVTAIEGVRTW